MYRCFQALYGPRARYTVPYRMYIGVRFEPFISSEVTDIQTHMSSQLFLTPRLHNPCKSNLISQCMKQPTLKQASQPLLPLSPGHMQTAAMGNLASENSSGLPAAFWRQIPSHAVRTLALYAFAVIITSPVFLKILAARGDGRHASTEVSCLCISLQDRRRRACVYL